MRANATCRLGIGGEFEAPQAPNTTVLVAGATGRVGRVLVRGPGLQGRPQQGSDRGGLDSLAANPPVPVARCGRSVHASNKQACT